MTAKNPTHPSVSIQVGMDEMGWSINEFADKLGVSRDTIAQLMHGQCGISPIVALALERIGWSDADFWMRRQVNYDLAQARRQMEAKAVPES
jgi:addiction module HigA family antidote